MPLHKLEKRTYLDAEGKATTDLAKADRLLGAEGDEITMDEAYRVGLVKTEPEVEEAPAVARLFYNAEGKRVKEDDPSATRMYLDNDPLRPDSEEQKAAATEADRLAKAQAEGQQSGVMVNETAKPRAYGDMRKAELVALAEERKVEPEGGQNREHYIAALEKADKEA